jgi:hypothetical protein
MQPITPAPRRMDSNAVAGKAALGGYLLGEAKGVQESRGAPMRSPMAPSAPPAQALPVTGFAKGGSAGGKNFIQGMHMKKGALHRELGVPEGQKIPATKMQAAASGRMGPLAEKRAHTAQTLGRLHKAEGGAVKAPKDPKLSPMVHVTQSVDAPLPNGGFAKGGRVRYADGGAVRSDAMQDKALVKKGIRQHENHEHGGEHTDLKLARGGKARRHPPKAKSHNAHAKPMKPAMPARGALSSAPMAPPMAAPMSMASPAPMPSRMRAARPMAPDMSEMATQSPPGAVPRLARGGKAPCR